MKLTTHRGCDIVISESGYFSYIIDDVQSEHGFQTLRQVELEIDRILNAMAKGRKLDLAVVDSAGRHGTITRLHLGTSHITTSGCENDRLYPNVEWIANTLAQITELIRAMEDLRGRLHPFSLKTQFGYGKLTAEEYGDLLTKVEEDYVERLAAAEAAA